MTGDVEDDIASITNPREDLASMGNSCQRKDIFTNPQQSRMKTQLVIVRIKSNAFIE